MFEPAEPITATFAEGDVTIPDGTVPVSQRALLGRIIAAVRRGANF